MAFWLTHWACTLFMCIECLKQERSFYFLSFMKKKSGSRQSRTDTLLPGCQGSRILIVLCCFVCRAWPRQVQHSSCHSLISTKQFLLKTFRESHITFTNVPEILISHWPELSLMATPNYSGGWEI